MSELWKPPHRDQSDGSGPVRMERQEPGPMRMERQELHATLADLARATEPEAQPTSPDVAGPGATGPAGRQALAALAARAAQSAEGSPSPQHRLILCH